MSAQAPPLLMVTRLAEHWLGTAGSRPQESLAWRDHALQTMLVAAQYRDTWPLAARLALALHPSVWQWGLYRTWAQYLEAVLAHAAGQPAQAVAELRLALGATWCAAGEWERAGQALR